jgi:hypothetical protein
MTYIPENLITQLEEDYKLRNYGYYVDTFGSDLLNSLDDAVGINTTVAYYNLLIALDIKTQTEKPRPYLDQLVEEAVIKAAEDRALGIVIPEHLFADAEERLRVALSSLIKPPSDPLTLLDGLATGKIRYNLQPQVLAS